MQQTTERRRTPRAALALGSGTHVVQDGLTAAIYVLLPVLAQSFGLSYAQVGLLKAVKTLSQGMVELGSGWLSERVGEVRLIAFGLVLTATGYLLLSVAPGPPAVAACLLVIGAGTALHHAPSSSLIVAACPARQRSSALGLYNASGDVGKLLFTGVVSLATGLGLAWQQIGLGYGLVALAAAAVVAFAARATLRAAASGDTDDAGAPARGWGILDRRGFAALLAVTGIDAMVQTSLLVFIAFLMLAKGLPLSVATAATVILLAGGVLGKAGCGFLAQRVGVRAAFALIQALTALGLVAVVVAPNWLALALLAPLGAVAQGSTSITYGCAAALIHPRRVARGYALMYASGNFVSMLGPLGFGLLADRFGIAAAMHVLALASLLAVPPVFLLPRAPDPAARAA